MKGTNNKMKYKIHLLTLSILCCSALTLSTSYGGERLGYRGKRGGAELAPNTSELLRKAKSPQNQKSQSSAESPGTPMEELVVDQHKKLTKFRKDDKNLYEDPKNRQHVRDNLKAPVKISSEADYFAALIQASADAKAPGSVITVNSHQKLAKGFVGEVYRVNATITSPAGQKETKDLIVKVIGKGTGLFLVTKGRCYSEIGHFQKLMNMDLKEVDELKVLLPYFMTPVQENKNSKERLVTISELAPGRSLHDIVCEENKEKIDEVYGKFGTAFGRWHQNSMVRGKKVLKDENPFFDAKVFAHCDPHAGNGFYDNSINPKTGQERDLFTLIDSETMSVSLKDNSTNPRFNIYYDLLYMLIMTKKNDKFGKRMDDLDWSPFQSFFKAYIETYSDKIRKNEAKSDRTWISEYLIKALKVIRKIKYVDFNLITTAKPCTGEHKKRATKLAKYLERTFLPKPRTVPQTLLQTPLRMVPQTLLPRTVPQTPFRMVPQTLLPLTVPQTPLRMVPQTLLPQTLLPQTLLQTPPRTLIKTPKGRKF
jgi:hypothetical protein